MNAKVTTHGQMPAGAGMNVIHAVHARRAPAATRTPRVARARDARRGAVLHQSRSTPPAARTARPSAAARAALALRCTRQRAALTRPQGGASAAQCTRQRLQAQAQR